MEPKKDLLDILLDENNSEPIVLANDDGEEVMFDQLCVIPYEEELYCVLSPISQIEGVEDGEVMIFHVTESENGSTGLDFVQDEKLCDKLFDIFQEMLDEEMKDN